MKLDHPHVIKVLEYIAGKCTSVCVEKVIPYKGKFCGKALSNIFAFKLLLVVY